jgi:hypothetical protein
MLSPALTIRARRTIDRNLLLVVENPDTMSILFLWGDCLKAHLVKGTSRESMGESYGFYRREVDWKGLNGAVTTTIYHTIQNIEGIHKLPSLSTTLTLNMQL